MTQRTSNFVNDLLSQTYPFILVDSFEDLEKGKSLTVFKNITGTEWFLSKNSSFSVNKFPETLLIESASQAAILLYRLSGYPILDSEKLVLSKIKAVFEKEVYIGDQIKLLVLATKMLEKFGIIDIQMSVENIKISEIKIMYSKINGK